MQPAISSGGRALTLVLSTGYLLMLTLASRPALHHSLHGDSDEPGHHCAVTALLDGQFDRYSTLPAVAVPPALRHGTVLSISSVPVPVVAPHSAERGRAPPLA